MCFTCVMCILDNNSSIHPFSSACTYQGHSGGAGAYPGVHPGELTSLLQGYKLM